MQEHSSSWPLTGLNVIDFGHYYAGPMVGMLLADQGANVVRIVRPGNRELQDQQYRLLNRNKKLLTLDLKTQDGKRQALSLIKHADVVIENFRPGVMKRLGLDYASVKDSNPGLVYLSLPGFASTDSERAHIQAWEGILAAAAGIYVNTSYVRQFLGFPPLYTSIPVNSMYGGIHGAIAIMAALLEREDSGCGTVIETSLAEAGMTAFGFKFCISPMSFEGPFRYRNPNALDSGDQWDSNNINRFAEADSQAVQQQKLAAGQRQYWSHPFSQSHRCADGRQVQLFFPFGSVYAERFFIALGLYEDLLRDGFVNVEPWKLATPLENNIANYFQMSETRQRRLMQWVADAFLLKAAEEWDQLLSELTPFAKVRTRQEYLNLKPMLVSGVLTQMDNGRSTLTVPGRFVHVSSGVENQEGTYREPEPLTLEEAKVLLSHRTIKFQATGKTRLKKKGDLLKGLKVLDLSNGIAGPMTSYVLAQYGAEIIKLDPPLAGGRAPLMMEVGQGKRSILADLKTAPGREVLGRLVTWADVVVHNKLDKVAQRLGISHAQLRALNSKVVSCQISACGGTQRGGWEHRRAFDPIAQAITGLMAHYGSLEEPHWHEGTMIADSMCGYGMAFGALLGIWRRRGTGCAAEVRTSLLQASNFIQLPWMIAEEGSCHWGEAQGQFAAGDHWWQRMYACRDGWIYVGTSEQCADDLAEVVTGERDAGEEALETAFADQDCSHWLSKLDAAGIACHRVLSVTDICAHGLRPVNNEAMDERAEGTGEILCWENHPCGSPIIIQAPDWVRIGEEKSWKRLSPTPVFGENSADILRDLNFSPKEIVTMIDLNAVRECPADQS